MDAVAIVAALAVVVAALTVVFIAREQTWRDATRSLQRELSELRAGARDREQMASVGRAASDLAQELKSPLQGVIGPIHGGARFHLELPVTASGVEAALGTY